MSSGPDEPAQSAELSGAAAGKRRKVVQRACDYCRRKKSEDDCQIPPELIHRDDGVRTISGDGPRMPNKRCSKCVSRRAECTYVEPFNKSRYTDSYVEGLESRLKRMEELLEKLSPGGVDLDQAPHSEMNQASTSKSSGRRGTASPAASSPASLSVSQLGALTPSSPAPDDTTEEDMSEDDTIAQREVTAGIDRLSFKPSGFRYHGKSSGWIFIKAAAGMGQELMRESSPSSSLDANSSRKSGRVSLVDPSPVLKHNYAAQPWLERAFPDYIFRASDFPPADLMHRLLESYFRHATGWMPLLHKPTFLKNIEDGLHLRSGGFGATVLLACALGSRQVVDDDRVLLDKSDKRSAGWQWFQRVDDMHKSLLAPVHLYDLQISAMMAMFIHSTTMPQSSWTVIGVGLRKALDVGAHRKSMYRAKPTIEDELWRRAFWSLLVLDITSSYGLGRPSCVHEEEYDVGLPIECDDEYWITGDPELNFKQPPGKPSKISAYVSFIQLCRIIAYALRTIYSIRKTRAQLLSGDQQWEERVVAELDSELNKWIDSIPEHLRWDPNMEDTTFLGQSATLYSFYYNAQIAVHRSFITTRRGSAHSLASLIICTNAARSCVQVLDHLTQRIGTPLARNGGMLFASGLVLLMSVWGQKRSGRHRGAEKDQEYIEKCCHMLSIIQAEYHVAERLKDILQGLLSMNGPSERAEEPRPEGSSTTAGDGKQSDDMHGMGVPSVPDPDQSSGSSSHTEAAQGYGTSLPPSFSRETRSSTTIPTTSILPNPQSQGQPELFGGSFHMDWQQSPAGPSQSPATMQTPQHVDPLIHNPQAGSSHAHLWTASTFSGPHPAQEPGIVGNTALYDQLDFPVGPSTAPNPEDGTADLGFSDCMFIDDTMTMWSNAPASFGWEDWDAYFNAVNGTQQPRG
ncbi:hypothetical protein ONZ51_g2571 [Trametes cubensis]|uniref:Xylanolytic transcriptional activator regulatory domain-containing protein n=1 Tax=Trametes cubensis TaxID=1111947 RepID=A0AAD7U214_9APHY|nr:hypothetical protein ONZ51_g2571 [Trametes cubensis]